MRQAVGNVLYELRKQDTEFHTFCESYDADGYPRSEWDRELKDFSLAQLRQIIKAIQLQKAGRMTDLLEADHYLDLVEACTQKVEKENKDSKNDTSEYQKFTIERMVRGQRVGLTRFHCFYYEGYLLDAHPKTSGNKPVKVMLERLQSIDDEYKSSMAYRVSQKNIQGMCFPLGVSEEGFASQETYVVLPYFYHWQLQDDVIKHTRSQPTIRERYLLLRDIALILANHLLQFPSAISNILVIRCVPILGSTIFF